MPKPLRIVHLEDDLNDAMLVDAALRQDGLECDVVHVSTREAFVAELQKGNVDLVISDYALPSFDGLSALTVVRQLTPDAPFILVSGTLGEEAAIESLRSGATDYVLKHRLTRLAPAVQRAVEEAMERRTRRAAEQALDRERTFLRAVLDSLEAGVVACDQDGALTFFNRATRELHGLPQETLPPEQWADHYRLFQADGKTPLTTEEIPIHRALRGEQLRNAEMVILQRNGAARIVAVSGQPIVDDQGARLGAVITMQDVTEHKKLERQFHQAQKMEAMGRLAAGVAHDFNNLLTVISGYCQLGIARIEPAHAVGRDLAEIAKAGERAANLTRQLLAFSRQQVLEPRVLDLNAVIVEVEKMLRRVIGADVELAFTPGTHLGQIRADAGQIEQVLMNLVVNARDAMPSGGRITIDTSQVEVDESGRGSGEPAKAPRDSSTTPPTPGIPCGRYVALTVTDSGVGMDGETAAQIFEPFFTTKEPGRGTGLGLSTVHGIVTQSGGHITVRSEPGQGTSFQILFPRVDGARYAEKPAPPQIAPGRGSETILVVDDDVPLLGFVSEVLRLQGYGVVQAADGEAALAALEHEGSAIDAVITDVVMPRLSGRALAERVLKLRPELALLFMSGYVGEHTEALGSLLGPRVGFVQKPFDPDLLLGKLREVLDARDAEAA
jgi:PAS domain S-box-containing protein